MDTKFWTFQRGMWIFNFGQRAVTKGKGEINKNTNIKNVSYQRLISSCIPVIYEKEQPGISLMEHWQGVGILPKPETLKRNKNKNCIRN